MAVPGRLPRVVPTGGLIVDNQFIPPKVYDISPVGNYTLRNKSWPACYLDCNWHVGVYNELQSYSLGIWCAYFQSGPMASTRRQRIRSIHVYLFKRNKNVYWPKVRIESIFLSQFQSQDANLIQSTSIAVAELTLTLAAVFRRFGLNLLPDFIPATRDQFTLEFCEPGLPVVAKAY